MQAQVRKVSDLFERSCKVCGHLKICAVFRAIGPLLSQNWDDESRPFDPESLATVCREFLSASTVEMLKEA